MHRRLHIITFTLSFAVLLGLALGPQLRPALAQGNRRDAALANTALTLADPTVSLRFRTEVVSLDVNVIDRHGLPIVGLAQDQFEVYENGVRQSIEYFRQGDRPASIGVIFDTSGSMQVPLKKAQAAFQTFLKTSHPDDEFFLVVVQDKPKLALDFTGGDELLQKVSALQADGNTALRDAIALGLEKLHQARHQKRALLVISDGVDNYSRWDYRKLMQAAQESDAQIYTIGTADFSGVNCGPVCRLGALNLLESLARQTGGEAFFLTAQKPLEEAVYRIALLLRQQYSLGYASTNETRQGRWRKVEVKVKEQAQKTIIRTRKGYYEAERIDSF